MSQFCVVSYTNGEPSYFSLGRVRLDKHCFVCNDVGRWEKEGKVHYPACGHIIHARCHYMRDSCPLCRINFTQVAVWEAGRMQHIDASRSRADHTGYLIRVLYDNKFWTSEAANIAAQDYQQRFLAPEDPYPCVYAAEESTPAFGSRYIPSKKDAFRAHAIAASVGRAKLDDWKLSPETLFKQYMLLPGDVFHAFRFTMEDVRALSYTFVLRIEDESLKLQCLCDFAHFGANFCGIDAGLLKSMTARMLYVLNYPFFRWRLMGLNPREAVRVTEADWERLLGRGIWTQ